MKQSPTVNPRLVLCTLFLGAIFHFSCKDNSKGNPSQALISQLNLKTGAVISCGPPEQQLGTVDFDMTCSRKSRPDFNLAIELLHSFEYDEAEKVFAKVIAATPDCAMAYWGVAMSNFHPLWNPPIEAELQKGAKAVAIAGSIQSKSPREAAYIDAIGLFYKDWHKTDHHTRCVNFSHAMEHLHGQYPDDHEAAIFYALSLDAAADPRDKSFVNQLKAGAILEKLAASEPNHPGIIHYIIHTYDYPGLAEKALPAAKRYAEVAPSSAHALHMPSHIFTRLGLWDDVINSNLKSVAAAQCYAEQSGVPGHWDEEFHGLDYLIYAYLQKGDNLHAKEEVDYLQGIDKISPVNFKVAYCYAAAPARYVLENKFWKDAAAIKPCAVIDWRPFPWQEAIIHFTRLLGAGHTGLHEEALSEIDKLKSLRDTLAQQKDAYKVKEVEIQIKAGEAWMQFESGHKADAISIMKLAADMEDSTEKHPVTPGEVLPARELLGDMLAEAHQYKDALIAYEMVLLKSPNRFNSVYGAGVAAERMNDPATAGRYFKQLISIAGATDHERPELAVARNFVRHK